MSLLRCLLLGSLGVGVAQAQVQVTATVGTPNASYTTLGAAFTAINAATHGGVITIDLTGNTTEAATATLNNGPYTSILIRPSGGAARRVGGTIAGNPVLNLSGAHHVTIDGLNTGGNSLAIFNASISPNNNTSTIRFIESARNNLIQNTILEGSYSNFSSTSGGTVFFSTDSTGAGNDNNTISNCSFVPNGSNLPGRHLHSVGSTGTLAAHNSGNAVQNCTFADWYQGGDHGALHLAAGNTDWTISGNRFFQTAPRAYNGQCSAIQVESTTGSGFSITGNVIGFANAAGTGLSTYTTAGNTHAPIFLNVGTATPTSVASNTIAGISVTSSANTNFQAIVVNGGLVDIGSAGANIIGSQSATDSLVIAGPGSGTINGIRCTGTASVTMRNNLLGGFQRTGGTTADLQLILCSTTSAITCSECLQSHQHLRRERDAHAQRHFRPAQ